MTLQDQISKSVKKIDQRITSHCILHERYSILSFISDFLLIISSIILTVLAIDEYLLSKIFHLEHHTIRILIIVFTLITLIYTIMAWKIDWKGKAFKHDQASRTLSQIKLEGKAALERSETEFLISFQDKCTHIQTLLIEIPEKSFLKLKAKHKRKVELSKFIDRHEGLPFYLIYLKFNILLLTKKLIVK